MTQAEIKKINEEIGCNNVRKIYFSESKGSWVIKYKTKLDDNCFDTLDELLNFLIEDSQD